MSVYRFHKMNTTFPGGNFMDDSYPAPHHQTTDISSNFETHRYNVTTLW